MYFSTLVYGYNYSRETVAFDWQSVVVQKARGKKLFLISSEIITFSSRTLAAFVGCSEKVNRFEH